MQIIRKAKRDDINRIQQLVGQAGLQTNGIEQNVDNFLIMMLGFNLAQETPAEIKDFTHFQNINSEQPIIMYYTF